MGSPTLAFGSPADVGLFQDRLDQVREVLQHQIDAGLAPTSVIVLARHGTIVMAEGFGTQKPGGLPVTVDHVFPLASGTKPLTAATLLSLAEDGIVGLNETLQSYIPEMERGRQDPPNLGDLLTHTAGLDVVAIETARHALIESRDFDVPEGRDLLSHILLEPALSAPFSLSPSTLMEYDNTNYSLLGEVIRRVTGKRFHDVISERIFEPLGLERSAVIVPDDLVPDLIERPHGIPFAPGGSETLILQGDVITECDDGGIGAFMSAMDMAVFCQMILNEGTYGDTRVLSKAAVRAMTMDKIPGVPGNFMSFDIPEASWGYGFWVGTKTSVFPYSSGGTNRAGVIRHGGAGGIHTWIDPLTGIVGVLFEVITSVRDTFPPTSFPTHRIEDMVNAAVTDR